MTWPMKEGESELCGHLRKSMHKGPGVGAGA